MRAKKKNILIFIAVLVFAFNYDVLMHIYPEAETNREQFIDYYYAKEKTNEFLYVLMFYILFMYVESKLFSAIAVFGLTISFCSMLDKVFFSNYDYITTDIVVALMALILSIKVYKNGEITTRCK